MKRDIIAMALNRVSIQQQRVRALWANFRTCCQGVASCYSTRRFTENFTDSGRSFLEEGPKKRAFNMAPEEGLGNRMPNLKVILPQFPERFKLSITCSLTSAVINLLNIPLTLGPCHYQHHFAH